MVKNIVIPSDFSIASLSLLRTILDKNSTDVSSFNIILLRGYETNDSITDLLFFSKEQVIEDLSSNEFLESLMILKNRFEQEVNSIRLDLFTGFTKQAFEHYLQANQVHEIYIDSSFPSEKTNYLLHKFIQKVSIPTIEIQVIHQLKVAYPEKNSGILSLFTTKKSVKSKLI